ncbi:MAG: nitroreductase family protein [Lachnospiraceae bacterium]
MNEMLESILTRRSCRSYTDQEITAEDLAMILQAGRYAPSGRNRQLSQFTVVRKRENIQALARVVGTALDRDEGYNFYDPKVIILVSNETENPLGCQDSACALENIFLMAHSLGIGSCWINQLRDICDRPEVRTILDTFGVPSNHKVWGIADLGYAKGPYKEIVRNDNVIKYAD